MRTKLFGLVCILAMAPLVAHAEESGLSYTYWEAGYVNADIDGISKKFDGYRVALSAELAARVFVFGAYSDINASFDGLDVSEQDYSIGLGYAFGLTDYLDLTGRVAYVGAKADFDGIDVDDNGYSAGIGVRGRFFDRLEVEAGVSYVDFSDLGSDTGIGISGQWYFTDRVAVSVSGSFTDDVAVFGLGFRGTWGRANRD